MLLKPSNFRADYQRPLSGSCIAAKMIATDGGFGPLRKLSFSGKMWPFVLGARVQAAPAEADVPPETPCDTETQLKAEFCIHALLR